MVKVWKLKNVMSHCIACNFAGFLRRRISQKKGSFETADFSSMDKKLLGDFS